MKKQSLRVSLDKKDFEELKNKAEALGVSVPTYSRIILKKKLNE